MNDARRLARVFQSAEFFIRRTFRYKQALWFAWSLLTWEQRMAFRGRFPALARELSAGSEETMPTSQDKSRSLGLPHIRIKYEPSEYGMADAFAREDAGRENESIPCGHYERLRCPQHDACWPCHVGESNG